MKVVLEFQLCAIAMDIAEEMATLINLKCLNRMCEALDETHLDCILPEAPTKWHPAMLIDANKSLLFKVFQTVLGSHVLNSKGEVDIYIAPSLEKDKAIWGIVNFFRTSKGFSKPMYSIAKNKDASLCLLTPEQFKSSVLDAIHPDVAFSISHNPELTHTYDHPLWGKCVSTLIQQKYPL